MSEEMTKEAEEICSKYFEENCRKKNKWADTHDLVAMWQDGYNKANEWHYVKDELPPENVPLNIITFDKNKKRRLWEGEYKGGNGQWWTGYFNHFIDVPYAWKEIELPKESE